MNDADVAFTTVTLATTAVALTGIEQLPLAPRTVKVCVSPGPSGVERVPTVDPARVSANRHGVIGTYTDESPELSEAFTSPNPPAPNDTATAAPIAAHRIRYDPSPRESRPHFIARPPWRLTGRPLPPAMTAC
jgi:hypothetical protein